MSEILQFKEHIFQLVKTFHTIMLLSKYFDIVLASKGS